MWVIDRNDMGYLPETVLRTVFEKIVMGKEEDRPYEELDVHFICDQFKRWDKFKETFIKTMFERKAVEKQNNTK